MRHTKWGKQGQEGHLFHCVSIKHACSHAENQIQEINVFEKKPFQTPWAGADHSPSPDHSATGWRLRGMRKTGHSFSSSPYALALDGSVKMQLSGRMTDGTTCSDSLTRRPFKIKLLLHNLDLLSVLIKYLQLGVKLKTYWVRVSVCAHSKPTPPS